MSLGDFLRKQLIDVIQWTEDSDGVLAYRYPMRDMEIQYGARLTVRESQLALFVNEGKIADQFAPGLYTLETQTLPLLTNLKHWYTGFESPFKSDVYFFSTRTQTDQRWGTQQPITIRDKDFGMVRLRGFGLYSFHVADPQGLPSEDQRHARALHGRAISRGTCATRSSAVSPMRSPSRRSPSSTWRGTRWSWPRRSARRSPRRSPTSASRSTRSSSRASRSPRSCRRSSTSASA